MPVWHEETREWVQEGRLVVLGVTQEQHADRGRLFAQWQGIDWPLLHDPLNLLESRAVPLRVAIDEHGIVRSAEPSQNWLATEFIDRQFDPPSESAEQPATAPLTPPPDVASAQAQAEDLATGSAWRTAGDTLALWGGDERLDIALAAYRRALAYDSTDADALFRLGVCYRRRYEGEQRRGEDFQQAVDCWQAALEQDPNQYIWRRRIQQYGPRLEQPYSFYDWVSTAQAELRDRGETPVELAVLPTGAELSHAQNSVAEVDESAPDPNGRITRDLAGWVTTEATFVPDGFTPGATVRVHLVLRVGETSAAHWNNEAGPTRVWLEPPAGWQVERQRLIAAVPDQGESHEPRSFEFELTAPTELEWSSAAPPVLRAYALYYVCEERGGQCLYRRRDIELALPLADVGSTGDEP